MAMIDGAADADPNAPSGPSGGPGGGDAGGGGPGAPPGGGPMLAALGRQQAGAQLSAPGPGNQADSLMKLRTAIGMMQDALTGLPAGSQQHRDVLRALQQLSRHLPQGESTAGVERTQLGDMLRNVVRNSLLQRIMANQGQGGGAGGGGGGQAPAPMPSMPLPGA